MKWVDVPLAKPKSGEILLNQSHVGLNYIDVYHRSGLYPLAMPHGIGMEAAGTVAAVGKSVKGLKVGDRVAYASGPPGSYTEARVMPANRVVKLPDEISNEQAAAAGQTVLFHAAAGGVGIIACQWMKQLGATVIGTVGSPAKAKLAKAHGCDHVINYNKQDFVKRVQSITKGEGVPVDGLVAPHRRHELGKLGVPALSRELMARLVHEDLELVRSGGAGISVSGGAVAARIKTLALLR